MADRLFTEAEVLAQLAARLRREPGIVDVRTGRRGALEIDAKLGGMERSFGVGIDNLYRMYLAAPAQLDQLIELLVTQVRNLPDQIKAKEAGAPNSDLFPQIKDAAFMRDAAQQGIRLAHQPLAGGLSVVYVADSPSTMRFLTQDDLKNNRMSLLDVHEIALENLARKAEAAGYMVAGEAAKALLISQSQDSYDAARILLPDLQEQASSLLPGQLVFGIPNRDFLVMLGDQDQDFVREIADIVRNDFDSQPYPLSPLLFAVVNGKIIEYPIPQPNDRQA